MDGAADQRRCSVVEQAVGTPQLTDRSRSPAQSGRVGSASTARRATSVARSPRPISDTPD
ncbi:hypothetical protein BJF90_37675 [Pseudonocardia sp. CNS-004]|nr:hypothetical protein BJF90_37675 [Pseudonocardia sp. CNS-004]